MGWNNAIPTFQLANVNMPTAGCFTTGHYVSKASLRACNITLKYETSSSALALSGDISRDQVAPEIQIAINDDWTASITPNRDCLNRVRSDFMTCRGSLASSVGNAILSCMGIKYKLGIADGVDVTLSAAADTNLCFFGGQLAIEYETSPFNMRGFSHQFKVSIQASLTIKVGLSTSGWAQLFRWVGTRALSMVSRISGAATRVIACITVTSTVIIVGTVVGTALLVYAMAALIANARSRGEFWGACIGYSRGYLDALFNQELSRSGYQAAIDRYGGGSLEARNGYIDAVHNAMQFGYVRTRNNLLSILGMSGNMEAEGPGVSESTYKFTGNRFPASTRNYFAGAMVDYLRFNRRRPHTTRIYIR